MKKAFLFAVIAAMTTMTSCNSNKKQVPFEYKEIGEGIQFENDSTVYGICGDGSAMNTLQLLTDSGDTLMLNTTEANEKNKCFGGYAAGDRMAVMLREEGEAKLVINLSTLLGNWVMPNPLDGSSESGFKIKEGGIVEGIEQSSITYKSWRIFNGKIEMQVIREGGGDEEEIYLYELVSLGADSLIIKDEEDTFEYSRQKVHKNNSKIKLEDASKEEFKI